MLEFAFNVFPVAGISKRGFRFGDRWPLFGKFVVEGNKWLLITRNIILRINRIHWALWNADCAINAFIGINCKKIGSFSKAVNGTHINAIGVLATNAGFSNNVGHGLLGNEKENDQQNQ